MGRRRSHFGVSFSLKRALGISSAKGRVSRAIGIPLTRSGRQRKAGRFVGAAIGSLLQASMEANRQAPATPAPQPPTRLEPAPPTDPTALGRGCLAMIAFFAIVAGAAVLSAFANAALCSGVADKTKGQLAGGAILLGGLILGFVAGYFIARPRNPHR